MWTIAGEGVAARHAAFEMMQLPDDENRHGRTLFLFDYIRHPGWPHLPAKDFKERPRLSRIEEYLADA